jgi:hypothetical protein
MSTNINPPEEIDFSDNASSVDVLILMDCTGSMGAWIDAAKKTALATASQLRKDMPKATFRLGTLIAILCCLMDQCVHAALILRVGV